MRARRFAVLLACVALVGAVLPATASATFSNSKTAGADAWWSSWDWDSGLEPGPNDAIEDRGISGWTSNSIWKSGNTAVETFRETNGGVWSYSYAPASGDQPRTWTEFSCFSLNPEFFIARKLNGATLEFMAPGEVRIWKGTEPWIQEGDDWFLRDPDEIVDAGMISVTGSWNPAGPASRSTYMSRERSEEFSYSDRVQQAYRNANATVSVVGADGTVYWYQTIPGSISESKSVSRFPMWF